MDKERNREGEREKRLLSTHRHFRYRCMRARAREKRARGCTRSQGRTGGGGEGSAWVVGKRWASLVRGGGKRGPFSEKRRSYVSLPETVLFFYKFRRPCRRAVPKGTQDSFPSSTNERQLCPHEGAFPPGTWLLLIPGDFDATIVSTCRTWYKDKAQGKREG